MSHAKFLRYYDANFADVNIDYALIAPFSFGEQNAACPPNL